MTLPLNLPLFVRHRFCRLQISAPTFISSTLTLPPLVVDCTRTSAATIRSESHVLVEYYVFHYWRFTIGGFSTNDRQTLFWCSLDFFLLLLPQFSPFTATLLLLFSSRHCCFVPFSWFFLGLRGLHRSSAHPTCVRRIRMPSSSSPFLRPLLLPSLTSSPSAQRFNVTRMLLPMRHQTVSAACTAGQVLTSTATSARMAAIYCGHQNVKWK